MSVDPTQTRTLRKSYAQRLRSIYGAINAEIRDGVKSRDVFGLRADALRDVENLPSFKFDTTGTKKPKFQEWLRRQLQSGTLETITRDNNVYIRKAYESGLRRADKRLTGAGVDTPDTSIQAAFDLPVHTDTLQSLYTRSFEDLQGINDALSDAISEELTQGFADGSSPTKMARRLTDRVDKIGKHRATLLARTETVRAHNAASLRRYQNAGITEVGAEVEFLSAGDDRVCPVCQSLTGRTYAIEDAKGVIPVHPQCRCAWIPKV